MRVRDLASGEQIGPDMVFPERVLALALGPDGALAVGFGQEIAVLTRR